jgi:hypothetical protein
LKINSVGGGVQWLENSVDGGIYFDFPLP